MRIVAIADEFIRAEDMLVGLQEMIAAGHEVEVVAWYHGTREALQADNIIVEQGGANAVALPREIEDIVLGAEIVVTQFAPIGDDLLRRAAAAGLRYIGVLRAGIENISTSASEHGVQVINTPGRNARAVAEFTIGMLLSEVRNIARSHEGMRAGAWPKLFANGDDVPEIGGRTIGIVGLGNVGKLVARFLAGMDAVPVFYDPYVPATPPARKIDDLGELMAMSDIVTIHARLDESTHHLIGEAELARMRPHAVLVNSARSGLIDEAALVAALTDRRIMGAALDVFDREPLPPGSPFLTLDNVTLTPHSAGVTADAFRNTPRLLAARLLQAIAD